MRHRRPLQLIAISVLTVGSLGHFADNVFSRPSKAAGLSVKQAGSQARIEVIRSGSRILQTNSSSFESLFRTGVRVYGKNPQLLLVTLSAESSCAGGRPEDYCSLRIVVGGDEAQPRVGQDFAFDSVGSSPAPESHEFQRSIGPLSPGIHRLHLQGATTTSETAFSLTDWHLTIQLF